MSLAENLGMDVIAEGVDTVAQLKQLQELRCKSAQGSFFEEPLTREQMEDVLARRSRLAE